MGNLLLNPWLLVVLAGVACAMSVILLWESLKGSGLPGCSEGSGCDAVTRSRWAKWGNIPVAIPGVGLYLMIFVAALFTLPAFDSLHRVGWTILLPGALMAAGAALWFLGLQGLIIRRICPY